MILKLLKKILHHFNYEVVSFAEMDTYSQALLERYAIARGKHELLFLVDYFNGEFIVKTRIGSPVCITVKRFRISDYGSIDYARACAEELCDKLNEKPSLVYDEDIRKWFYEGGGFMDIYDESLFPEVTFENSPQKVELKIEEE